MYLYKYQAVWLFATRLFATHPVVDACLAAGSSFLAPPHRPPITLLRAVAAYVKDLEVVDIRPTEDVAACLLHTARSVRSVINSPNATYCAAFEDTVKSLGSGHHEHHGHGHEKAANYSTVCSADYRQGVPDGDVYVFWQRLPGWSVGGTVGVLRDFAKAGLIRPSARVVTLFDLTSWRDAGDWQHSDMMTTWWHQSGFDERTECVRVSGTARIPAKYQSLCLAVGGAKPNSGRACGMWAAGAFPLSPAINASERPHSGTSRCPFSNAELCVPGIKDAEPACLAGTDGLGDGVASPI